MNQHSKRGRQANGNSVDEMQRGATRPAAVVAIVLCVGFAVAMVAIWQFRKPPSHQEMQTQPKAAVQTEIPEPEQTEIPEPEQTEIPKPKAVSRVSVPLEPSTAAPVSQANPTASQVMDDHANPPAPAQDDQSYDLSHDLNGETVTFDAVNPSTQIPGRMTVTISGAFRGNRLSDGESSVGSHLKADQEATFSFVPNDRYSPSYSATTRLQISRDTTDDSIFFDFGLATTGSDGSSQQFMLREIVTVTKDGAKVAFEQR